jgi:hypothetical protein
MYTAVSLKARISCNYKERVWLLKLQENSVKLPARILIRRRKKIKFQENVICPWKSGKKEDTNPAVMKLKLRETESMRDYGLECRGQGCTCSSGHVWAGIVAPMGQTRNA